MSKLYEVLNKAGLKVLNGPGSKPSSSRFACGEVVEFDGTEHVDIDALLRVRAIKPYRKRPAKKEKSDAKG